MAIYMRQNSNAPWHKIDHEGCIYAYADCGAQIDTVKLSLNTASRESLCDGEKCPECFPKG